MASGKKSIKEKLNLGLIILTPLCVLLYLAMGILKIFGKVSYEILFKYLYADLPWTVYAIAGLFLFFLLALFIGSAYYSKKARISGIIDKFMLNIPLIKHFWNAQNFGERNAIDLSKLKTALIQSQKGVWKVAIFTGEQKMDNGMKFTKVLIPTYPLPFTGWLRFINEEELVKENSIIYLENPVPEIIHLIMSFGFLGPEQLKTLKN